eukprot:MONOS_10509.1-p1 / transcript=MONOS_10509.1 / gene=MONOS_10509 / organism=Monocercomonoides_exilis_PA203 / gene_product=unspecified product / transcript_product=unspecified product / location=Mono_scaffold00480:47168-48067(+) / protein_length=249 / sequence_SO=supercontig / SO=protein_coding / is_pseudo=false
MNEIVDGMNEEEFQTVFTEEQFNKILQMIEEKTLSLENAILLLKRIGYCKVLLDWRIYGFNSSLLRGRFEKMIDDEEEKNEEKNESLLIDLCECYLFLNYRFSSELISMCVPCLLKVALKKEENEVSQKEVEMALLALSNIECFFMEQKLYLNEIKEIIQYHQEYHNLTRLAYQTAWRFLVSRLWADNSLEEAIVIELRFAREAIKELEELSKYRGTRNWSDLSVALFRCYEHQGAIMEKFALNAFVP